MAGRRRGRAGPRDFDFAINSSDVGKLLERVGYPGTVRGSTAIWKGAQLEGLARRSRLPSR